MAKPFWNPEELDLFPFQIEPFPLAEFRRIWPQVNGYVPDVTRKNPNQLALRLSKLIVDSTQDAAPGKRLIVLHKLTRQIRRRKRPRVKDLGKPTTIIAVLVRPHELDITQSRTNDLHTLY